MSRQQEREEFVAIMTEERVPVDVARQLMRAAATLHRVTAQSKRIEYRLECLLAPYGIKPIFQGDPRGAVVKLQVPSGKTDGWGQTGLCVPT